MAWRKKGSLGSKYHNRKTVADGMVFDSQKEASRWLELKMLQQAGKISGLTRQVPFELVPKQKTPEGTLRAVNYIADFAYFEDGKFVVEDTKGVKTDEYKIKRKLMYYFRNILVRET